MNFLVKIKILKRIAFQILENNFEERELILVGISGQGMQMTRHLHSRILEIKPELEGKR